MKSTVRQHYGRYVALALLVAFAADVRAVTIEWVLVGDPGNAADTTVMKWGHSRYGSVAYNYRIGKYDVTNSQYVEFLNAKDPSGANTLDLYTGANRYLARPPARLFGIIASYGNANGSKYSVIGGCENHPVNFVNWYDAIRFANWLNNGQGNGDTESGSYTLLGGTPIPSNATSVTREAGASVVLPNVNEWHKAAYYNPVTKSYFKYPASSDTPPLASGPTATPNSANYNKVVGTFTDVDAYPGAPSPFGAFDMAGNVLQWNETSMARGQSRGLRGASFDSSLDSILRSTSSNYQNFTLPHMHPSHTGFRVVSIP